MENINIKINKRTRQVNLSKSVIGNDGENLQDKLVFFFDEFVNGTARLELLKQGETASYIMLTKVGETYELPVRSVITKAGRLNMQLVITEGTNDEEIPIFKSNQFYMIVNSSINAETLAEEDYPDFIDTAETKLNAMDDALEEVDNLDISASKSGSTTTITITDRNGNETSVNINDGENGTNGQDGQDGVDAKINGVNTLTIEAGDNITLNQSGSTLTISSTASGGTSNYSDLSNKPKINNVELSGNKSTSDLGLFSGNYNDLSNKPTIPTNSDFTLNGLSEKSYNNLTDKPTIPTVPTNVSAFTNDAGYLTQHQSLSGYVKNTDYASSSVAGVIKTSTDMSTDISSSSGKLRSRVIAYVDYANYDNRAFISKGTLDNVLNAQIGNINTILATLTTPSNNGGE